MEQLKVTKEKSFFTQTTTTNEKEFQLKFNETKSFHLNQETFKSFPIQCSESFKCLALDELYRIFKLISIIQKKSNEKLLRTINQQTLDAQAKETSFAF